LVCGAAGQATESALYGAGGLVDIALERGGLVFVVGRHGCGCYYLVGWGMG
jgi:ABC-type siderophore export system fused ATPase/permease subunit